METARSFVRSTPTRFGAYLALQCALMRRFIARGGTPEEFCSRLAPVFHRRYGPLLLENDPVTVLRFDSLCSRMGQPMV
ncbi:hypothetical protein BH23GEM6_BH23GEM6_08660 [soil metagenome]